MSGSWTNTSGGTVGHGALVADESVPGERDGRDAYGDANLDAGVTLDFAFHVARGPRGPRGERQVREGAGPPPVVGDGKVPRLAKLMALAIRFEELIRTGEVKDFAEIAALGHVTKARVSQIANLNNLAPDIQEEILLLPKVRADREVLAERHVRGIALEPDWRTQRERWGTLKTERAAAGAAHGSSSRIAPRTTRI